MNIRLWVPPPISGGGGDRRSFRAGWGQGNPHSLLIGIAIGSLQRPAIAVWNIRDFAVRGLDGKCPRRFDRYPPDMRPHAFESRRYHRPHQIARLVAKIAPAPLAVASRKAQVVGVAHLATAMPLGFDQQGQHVRCAEALWRRGANAGCIHPVCFGQTPAQPVVLRPTTRAGFQAESSRLQTPVEFPSRRVDGGGITQRGFGLRQDASQPLLIMGQKLLDIPCPLFQVTGLAGQRQICHPIGAAPHSGHDVLHLQGDVLRPTVGACPVPLGQEVLADFVSEQGPLLIGDASYFRVLQVLQIEAHQFLREGGNVGHAAQARHPGQDVGHPGEE